jgi:hypothetical protein
MSNRALTEDEKNTLAFIQEITSRAMREAGAGDPSLMNNLAKKSDALSYYLINVVTRPMMTPEQFAIQRPADMKDAARLQRELAALEAASENGDRLTKIEEAQIEQGKKIDRLLAFFDEMAKASPSKGKGKQTGEGE